ncbi:hypothetical protein ZHAS_00002978 [Anopheles sinensis]|uniref:Uncharacterized protein n=1 Tax=Anopheles sinensis TaxID=74873 RepID=A0A084VDF5_ANOSI|nr:hypothetical protein ZHAS_00002978 [Anopheles sinensis]
MGKAQHSRCPAAGCCGWMQHWNAYPGMLLLHMARREISIRLRAANAPVGGSKARDKNGAHPVDAGKWFPFALAGALFHVQFKGKR